MVLKAARLESSGYSLCRMSAFARLQPAWQAILLSLTHTVLVCEGLAVIAEKADANEHEDYLCFPDATLSPSGRNQSNQEDGLFGGYTDTVQYTTKQPETYIAQAAAELVERVKISDPCCVLMLSGMNWQLVVSGSLSGNEPRQNTPTVAQEQESLEDMQDEAESLDEVHPYGPQRLAQCSRR